MKRHTSIVILFILVMPVFSQVTSSDSMRSGEVRSFQPKKLNYGLALGSEFTTMSGYGSALNTYITPRVSYNLSKRFSIGGGISIIQTNYFNAGSYYPNEQNAFSNGNFTSAVLFVNGHYLVNDRLTISGSAFKQFPITKDPLPYNPFNPVSPNGAQGVDFNIGYKVGKNMYFQAGFRYSEGLNPYNPYNPFGNDSFRSGTTVPGFGFGNQGW